MCELHLIFKAGKNNRITEFEKNCLFRIMENSAKTNDDGHGIYAKNIWYRFHKKFSEDKKLKSKINETIGNFILAHNRWASNGEICEENTHPFNLKHIVFLHNGIVKKYEDKEINSEMNDSLFIAKKLNEEFGRTKSEKKTIRNVLSKIEGSISAFIYFKKTGNLFYFKNANGFTFALTDGNCIIGSSDYGNIEKSISYNFLGFRIPYIKILSKLKPDDDTLYQITENGIKEVEKIDTKISSYSYSVPNNWYDKQEVKDEVKGETKEIDVMGDDLEDNGGVGKDTYESDVSDIDFPDTQKEYVKNKKFNNRLKWEKKSWWKGG